MPVLEITAGRLALDLVLRGWEGRSVLSTPSSFHCFSCLSQGLTFLPYRRDGPPGSWVGHLLPRAFLPGIISQAGPRPFPVPLTRHVCKPAGVRFKRWRSQRRLACGNWSQGPPPVPFLLPTRLDLASFTFRTTPPTHSPSAAPCLPQTFRALWVFHPGQSSRTVGVPALSALGTVLTCNHSGKQPPAGLGRGWRGGGGELQQTRRETKASSGALRLAVGWVPRLQGPAQAGLPWRSQAVPALSGSVLLAASQRLELCVGPGTQGLKVLKVTSREEKKKEGR